MSPVIDVSRDPRWGRTYETFGEDTYLVTQMGLGYIRVLQADGRGTACIGKHFLGYAETQAGLNCAAARINDRELYEVFATPFEAAGRRPGAQRRDGQLRRNRRPVRMREPQDIPRAAAQNVGFEDADKATAAALCACETTIILRAALCPGGPYGKKAGVDTEIPVGAGFAALPGYVREGKLDEALLDESVRRILTIKFRYGLFEHPYVDVEAVRGAMSNARKQELSARIAAGRWYC